jgi:hypothetical protein
MLEHHHKKPIPYPAFLKRMTGYIGLALLFTGLSLLAGILGYRYFENLSWVDSFVNAAMILGGMGEIDPLKTTGGKIFAGIYALYSGLWVITCMAMILAPIFHRILHKFHAEG